MTRALLIGREPPLALEFAYVTEGEYEAVVIGSLTLGQLLRFREERVLSALAEGNPVYLFQLQDLSATPAEKVPAIHCGHSARWKYKACEIRNEVLFLSSKEENIAADSPDP